MTAITGKKGFQAFFSSHIRPKFSFAWYLEETSGNWREEDTEWRENGGWIR